MSVIRLGDSVSLTCSKVLDETRLGLVDEDEEVQAVAVRSFCEARASKHTLAMADELASLALQPRRV
jgi:predicted HTH domain antitoxin